MFPINHMKVKIKAKEGEIDEEKKQDTANALFNIALLS